MDCSNLESISIGSGVTSIGEEAFSGCTDLVTVTFKGRIAPTTFGSSSFLGIKSGTVANVPAGRIGTGSGKYDSTKYPFLNDSPLKLNESGSGSGGSDTPSSSAPAAPRPLTPEEIVAVSLTTQQQINNYGATPNGFTKMLYDNVLGRVP